jgi:DNA polymerase III alpha subunit
MLPAMTTLWYLQILKIMIQNKVSEMIFSESDICDLVMQGHDIADLKNMIVDDSVDLKKATLVLEYVPEFLSQSYTDEQTIEQFHRSCQQRWHIPTEYQQMDIAKYILELCENESELQRCGHELMLYQERDLFDLLRYLKYLVDVMTANHVIWGVGRGSSVASYVLYKLKIHRIDSLYYNLSPEEFLR